jgi:hypothetical protein
MILIFLTQNIFIAIININRTIKINHHFSKYHNKAFLKPLLSINFINFYHICNLKKNFTL